MNKQLFHSRAESKRGVALIIVLGFLSIMIIMALTFLTQSRTERLVAGATMEAHRGRQLVRTALHAAMNDYSVDLWNPDRYMLPPSGMDVFPSIAPVASVRMPGGRSIGDDNIRLMVGEARRWLPRRYLTTAVTNDVADAEWILVREDPTDSNSRILGRYAYVCFDMSGGMDANLIARKSGVGTDGDPTNRPSIRAVGMGKLTETASASTFKSLRLGWHGFDNLAELILLTNGKYNGGEQNYQDEDDDSKSWGPPGNTRWRGNRIEYSAGLTSSEVTDLVPYSLAAYRGEWDWGAGDWTSADILACDDSDNWSSSEWNSVLDDVSGQLASQSDAVKALQDYVSEDLVPQGVDYPSSKNVPMFNELEMSLRLRFVASATGGVGQLFLDIQMEFETWYPFPSDDNTPSGTFTIDLPSFSGGSLSMGTGDIAIRANLANGANVTLPEANSSPAQLSVNADWNNGKPKKVSGVATYNIPVLPIDPTVVLSVASELRIRGIRMLNPIEMEQGGLVDQMRLPDILIPSPVTTAQSILFSMESDDPRLNHDKDTWSKVDTPTPNAMNASTIAAGYGDPGGEGLYMYCRNGPMVTPGEIGFISTGNPWETIDLCTPEGATMLSKLVASSDILTALGSTNTHHTYYTNGTINPNTSSTNVMLSAFADLTTREVPNTPDLSLAALKDDDALALAASILDAAQSKQIEGSGSGAFMSGSDWVRVPAMGKAGALAGEGLNKNQRESLIRNTWGLFSPNNSLFTVLVIGQAIKESPTQVGIWNADDDMLTGERRGVALVWRDPTPSGAQGQHEMFVRMFKFLDE